MGIIDCHTHIVDPSHFNEAFAADLRRAWGDLTWTGVTPEEHWEAVRDLDGAIVLAFDAPACGFVVPDEYVAGYVAQHPDKLIGFCSVDPMRSDAAVFEIEAKARELFTQTVSAREGMEIDLTRCSVTQAA